MLEVMWGKEKNKLSVPKGSEPSRDPNFLPIEEAVSDEEGKEYYSLGGDNDLEEAEWDDRN
jgi:hypothetical protein